jgi:branched-chain amino acid transport system ATP-binding protein
VGVHGGFERLDFASERFVVLLKLNNGTTILLVEQMAHQALGLCDRAYVLAGGHIQIEGSRAEMLADERVIEAYLGRKSAAVPPI